MSVPPTLLIANPVSGGGRARRRLERSLSSLRSILGPFDVGWTRGPGDGTRIAREAAALGRQWVVAVGGDGTASEVATGLVEADGDAASKPAFSLLPSGTGNDLGRALGAPRDLLSSARWLSAGGERPLDVGLASFRTASGSSASRCFVNVADAGVGGEIAVMLARSPRRLGPLSYLAATARGLLAHRDRRVRYRLDEGAWVTASVTAFCICNGRFFGSGMRIAPGAELDDGLFDLTLLSGLGARDLALHGRRLYDGTIADHPGVVSARASKVEIEPLDDGPVLLDLDGDPCGALPATFTVLPRALRLRAGPAR